MSAVGSSDGVGRAVCALTRAWRGEAAEPPTHSIADGTALHRGRVGSRHFERVPFGTLFFLCGDAAYSPFHRSPRRKPNEVFAMGRGESATITFVTQ